MARVSIRVTADSDRIDNPTIASLSASALRGTVGDRRGY
jgi:hypothetical protein